MSSTKIFAVNLALCLLVLIVHVGVLVLYLNDVQGVSVSSLHLVVLFIAIELVIVVSAIFALAGAEAWKKKALRIHGVIFGFIAALIFLDVFDLLVNGLSGGNFFFTPGFSAALVGYGVFVSCRAFYQGENNHILNAGWYAAGITFLLELLLMYRAYVEIST
jgi:hypothetical protein